MTPPQPEEPANASTAADGPTAADGRTAGAGAAGDGPTAGAGAAGVGSTAGVGRTAGAGAAEKGGRAKGRQRQGGLRRLFARLTADPSELQAEQLQQSSVASGAQPIASCADREKVCVAGTLRTVTFRPRGGVPALEANLWDGTGEVAVIWLGRREIPGITPGRNIRVRGRITCPGGHRSIYNPIYELQPAMAE